MAVQASYDILNVQNDDDNVFLWWVRGYNYLDKVFLDEDNCALIVVGEIEVNLKEEAVHGVDYDYENDSNTFFDDGLWWHTFSGTTSLYYKKRRRLDF